jgi:hypothetical protein
MFKKLWKNFGVVLSEPSTWRGLVMILTAVGLGLTHEQQEAIVIAGLAVSGLIGVFFKEAGDTQVVHDKISPEPVSEPIPEPVHLDESSDLSDIIDQGRS